MVFRNGAVPVTVNVTPVEWQPEMFNHPIEDGFHSKPPSPQYYWAYWGVRASPEVYRLVRQHGADLVHFFPAYLGPFGFAELRTDSYPSVFFGVSGALLRSFAGGVGTAQIFAHEVGHNLGGGHDPPSAYYPPSGYIRPYAFGHTDLTSCARNTTTGNLDCPYTVMSYATEAALDNNPRTVGRSVPFFSSVRHRPNGWTLGIAGERENERVVQETIHVAVRGSEALVDLESYPRGITAIWTGRDTVRLTWSEHVPAGSCLLLTLALTGGGDDLLEWCGDDDELQPDWLSPVNGADGSYTGVDIAGLRPGGRYKVTATVREGELSEDVLEPYAEMKHLRSPVLELAPPSRVDGAPAPPNNVSAHVTGPDRVRLNWSDNSRNETGFEIWLRQWSGDDAEPVWRRQGNSLPAGTVSAEVSGLSVEERLSVGFTEVPTVLRGRYSLLVVAHNSSGFSASERFDLEFLPGPHPPPSLPGKVPACLPRPTGLEVGGYHVFACFERPDGAAVRAWSTHSGLLYFFNRDNVEILIKVLDGCGVNGHRWVFVAPVTDLAFNLQVEGPGGPPWFHTNRLSNTAETRSDTSAFACTPEA